MKNHMENTSTFLVLLLKKWRRVQSMYDPNMRRLENLFQRVLYLDPGRKYFGTSI